MIVSNDPDTKTHILLQREVILLQQEITHDY